MGPDRKLQLLAAAGDVLRSCRVLAARLDESGAHALADWLEVYVGQACRGVSRGLPVEPELRCLEGVMQAAAQRLGLDRSVVRASQHLAVMLRWERFHPIRDGPPSYVMDPVETQPPHHVRGLPP